MNSEEQTLIDGLFTRLQQAEAGSAPRDAQAQARINEHLARQPAATYYMAQALLVQEAALKQLDQQNRQLQAELAQAKVPQAAAPTGGSFLSGLFGSGASAPAQAPAAAPSQPPGSGGWRDGPAAPAQAAPAPQAAPAALAMGGGFLGGALKTAAGVAGGVMLAQGISSLFHHNQQPQVIEEIIEQPTPASDSGWGSGNQQYANSGSGIEDVGLDDDGFFSDDDSYV